MSPLILADVGFILLVAIAIVVGIVDATQTPGRRLVAAQRRQDWEARQLLHGTDPYLADAGDDD